MRADTDQIPAVPADPDDLVGRLRARRSADEVAAAYAAVHGHPVGVEDGGQGWRWSLGARPALVAVCAVLLLGIVAGVVVLWPGLFGGGEVRSLGAVGAVGDASRVGDAGAADDGAGGPTASGAAQSGVAASSGAPASSGVEDGFGFGSPAPAVSGGAEVGAGTGVVAHVVGQVRDPGLVELPVGARIADAVEAAGGATADADLSGVNLARSVTDGEQIYVPKPGEVPPAAAAPADAASAADGVAGASSSTGAGGPGAGTVDVNTADTRALEALPGIGPSLAAAIIDWRTTNGPFASVDELEDVPGIGPSVLEQIRSSVTV